MEERAVQFLIDREQRVDAMWARYCRAMMEQGLAEPGELNQIVAERRCKKIYHSIKKGRPAGWRFRSALEAFDIGVREYKPAPAPVSTEASPGTYGKLNILSSRMSSGHDLWHPKDNRVLATTR